ncbi:uncharacterized protein LOC124256837 isoform X2 [Haliotis rubra]|uniref:uncharacterized protein LOC124256837 isoform X2 n=1 Tax=Haliotis rubra TaxID=36100 RepID=UPI001EE5B61E|nr:uncharacterized protein LOC124256837 isoform X2 [Haliotis rubra]
MTSSTQSGSTTLGNSTENITETTTLFRTTSSAPGGAPNVFIITSSVSILLVIVSCIALLVYCVRTWGKSGSGFSAEERDKLTSLQENADFILSRQTVMVDKACHVVMEGETPLSRIASSSRPSREADGYIMAYQNDAGSAAAYPESTPNTDSLYAQPAKLNRSGQQNASPSNSVTRHGATPSMTEIDALYAKPIKKKHRQQSKTTVFMAPTK